jgi:hypothetical protein
MLPCGCSEAHSHEAWLEAHFELGRVESVNGPLDWRSRRDFIINFSHKWDISKAGKIDP